MLRALGSIGAEAGGLLLGLRDAILPPACAACGHPGREPFCEPCAGALLPAPSFRVAGAARSIAVFEYGGPAAVAILRLKYDGRPEVGRALGLALRPRLRELEPFELVVPVPIARRRLVERGYNQARELVRGLEAGDRRRLRPRALLRRGGPRDQIGLDRDARLANLEGAFVPGPAPVEGARVVLIDDVVTTGATALSAVRVLRAAGAREVSVLALARTA